MTECSAFQLSSRNYNVPRSAARCGHVIPATVLQRNVQAAFCRHIMQLARRALVAHTWPLTSPRGSLVNVGYIPSLGRIVADVLPRKTGSIPGRSLRDFLRTMWQGQVFLPVLRFSPVTIFRPMLHTYRRCVVLTCERVVTPSPNLFL